MECVTVGAYSPKEILDVVTAKGEEKARSGFGKLLILSVLGGMFIALGYLGYLRVAASVPPEWAGLGGVLGACVFPVGLMAVLLAGGELITGNMLVVAVAWFRKRIPLRGLCYNWAVVTLGNLVGAVATAWFFGHVVGLTEGALAEKTVAIALAKVDQSFWPALVSGIGCNIFVGLGTWLCSGAKDFSGKVLACWFPVMTFVAIGFQHVVANMFIVPAAIFTGVSGITWLQFIGNAVPVYIGNVIGGAVVLGLAYAVAYREKATVKQ